MAEDHRADAEGKTSGAGEGGLDIHVRGGGLQLGEDEKSAGQLSGCRMSQGRSVPVRLKRAQAAAVTSTDTPETRCGNHLSSILPNTGYGFQRNSSFPR